MRGRKGEALIARGQCASWHWAEPWWEQVVVHWAEKHAMHLRTGNVNWYMDRPRVLDHELQESPRPLTGHVV